MLNPLYDISISAMSFTLFSSCANIGASDITLHWTSPDRVEKGVKFKTKEGEHMTINEFAWARGEVSASANLIWPGIWFHGDRFWPFAEFVPGVAPDPNAPPYVPPPFVPGATRQVVKLLNSANPDCSADSRYNITYLLRQYSAADLQR
jgi:hypothetical protein